MAARWVVATVPMPVEGFFLWWFDLKLYVYLGIVGRSTIGFLPQATNISHIVCVLI
jgi:hypothetical protein